MKRLRILYFSATGNTKRAVDLMRKTCAEAGIDVETFEFLDPALAELSAAPSGTETLIAFPALGLGAPHLVLRGARRLPEGGGTVARVLGVCGAETKGGRSVRGWPGSGLEQVELILRRKGYDVASTGFISYPSNWVQVSDPPAGEIRDRLLAARIAAARAIARGRLP